MVGPPSDFKNQMAAFAFYGSRKSERLRGFMKTVHLNVSIDFFEWIFLLRFGRRLTHTSSHSLDKDAVLELSKP